jgi:hypothetical protein
VITLAQATDTLRLLIPGFILMKVFYSFGLKTKRSDAQWVLWSLLAAAPIAAVAGAIRPKQDLGTLVLALALAVLAGALFALMWTGIVRVLPQLGVDAAIRAWDVVLGQSRWLQIETTDERVFTGRSLYAARSVDTDDLDLYLVDPRVVKGHEEEDLPGVEGILLTRGQIAYVAVLKPSHHLARPR